METRGKKIDFKRLAAVREASTSAESSDCVCDQLSTKDSNRDNTFIKVQALNTTLYQNQAMSSFSGSESEVEKPRSPSVGSTVKVSDENKGQTSDSESQLDAELEKLKVEQAAMKARLQNKKHEKKDLIKKLKAENQVLKTKLRLSGSSSYRKANPKPAAGASRVDQGAVNLKDLRQMDNLVLEVEEQMQAYGDLDSSSSSNDSEQTSVKGRKRSKPLRSGQTAKVAHGVKRQLRWPHTLLRFSYAQSNLTFVQLDFPLLVAGEIACILSHKLGEDEKVGRLRLLQAVAYHSKAFEWQACLDFFSTCLLEVERGERAWNDNRGWLVEEANTLYQHPLREKARSTAQASGGAGNASRERRRWFCQAFQKGDCNHRGAHDATVKGVRRTVEHFCASCFQKTKVVRMHAETSKDCPLQSSQQ